MSERAVYPDMRDSGLKWLGSIPAHWPLVRAKFSFVQSGARGNQEAVLLASSQKYGVCPQSWLEGVVKVAENTDLQQFKTVHRNDFVISLRSFQGGFERSDFEGVCSPAYQVFRAVRNYDNNYLKWFFKNHRFIDAMNALTVGIREGKNIKYDDFASSFLPIPPLEEQRAIASYLDGTCALIDEIISEIKAGLEAYKQWKASVIYETVTRGLNPGAPLRDSGETWMGRVPAHWSLHTLYQLAVQVKDKNAGLSEQNLLSLSYGKIKRRDINTTDGLLPASFEGYNIIQPGDIVLRLTDLQNDHTSLRVGLSGQRGIITSAYVTIRPVHRAEAEFLYYLLHAYDLKKGFYGMGSGVRQGLNFDEVKDLKVVLPPPEEQREIVSYLDRRCGKIDEAAAAKEALIPELERYRRSLICEAVTGKRRVVPDERDRTPL